MLDWLETISITLLAISGIIVGLLTKKLEKKQWLIVYIFPLTLIIMIALTRHFYWLGLHRPFIWLCRGRTEYVIFSFAIPVLFGTLIPRLSIYRQKVVLFIFVAVSSVVFFIIPFLSPILNKSKLGKLETIFTSDGICLQTTEFTCGPAAAVTALRQLGVNADEGRLAISAYTSPQTGTSDDLLAKAIEKLYGWKGVQCKSNYFRSIDDLKQNCPAIVVIKASFLIDHYITVLEVTDEKVVIGDPSEGREELTYKEFKNIWRSVGIVVKRVT